MARALILMADSLGIGAAPDADAPAIAIIVRVTKVLAHTEGNIVR